VPECANEYSPRREASPSPASIAKIQIYHPLSAEGGKVSFSTRSSMSKKKGLASEKAVADKSAFSERTSQCHRRLKSAFVKLRLGKLVYILRVGPVFH
jgi:hypothetical protein